MTIPDRGFAASGMTRMGVRAFRDDDQGAALSAKRGKRKKSSLKGASKSMYESMSKSELRKMAKTKRKGKPKRKRKKGKK